MPDREKVIRAVDSCFNYWLEQHRCLHPLHLENVRQFKADALSMLKKQETVVRCKDCKHLFDGEHTKNCCDALMEKAGWLKEIAVSQDWFCADGERQDDDD